MATLDQDDLNAIAALLTPLDTKLNTLIARTGGAGAIEWTICIKDNIGGFVDGAEAWVTTDALGTNVVAGTIYTNGFGEATFYLDAGTYYLWGKKAGVQITNPNVMNVA